MYSTFESYQAAGGQLSKAAYLALAPDAAAEIDSRTFGQATGCTEMQAQLNLCECRLIDALHDQQNAAKGVKAATTDGYSETYSSPAECRQAREALCRRYLTTPVNLLLAGGRCMP